jgi:tRNA 2-thiouridine synthesizing protein A
VASCLPIVIGIAAKPRHNRRAAMESPPMTPDETIDCEGLLCPLPVLKARKLLLRMPVDAVLCVRATDPMAAIDLPHFCAEAGHVMISATQRGTVQVYFIRRGPLKN